MQRKWSGTWYFSLLNNYVKVSYEASIYLFSSYGVIRLPWLLWLEIWTSLKIKLPKFDWVQSLLQDRQVRRNRDKRLWQSYLTCVRVDPYCRTALGVRRSLRKRLQYRHSRSHPAVYVWLAHGFRGSIVNTHVCCRTAAWIDLFVLRPPYTEQLLSLRRKQLLYASFVWQVACSIGSFLFLPQHVAYMFQATSDCATLHHTRINFCHATSRATKVAPCLWNRPFGL